MTAQEMHRHDPPLGKHFVCIPSVHPIISQSDTSQRAPVSSCTQKRIDSTVLRVCYTVTQHEQ